MSLRGTRPSWLAFGVLLGAVLAVAAPVDAKTRSVLVLPFAPLDLGREEQWIGEGMAESLRLAMVQIPTLVPMDRSRLRGIAQPEVWDEAAALSAARTLGADVAIYG